MVYSQAAGKAVNGGGVVPQFAIEVATPAADAAAAQDRAGVAFASTQRDDARREPLHVHRHVAVGGRVVPELAIGIGAPALDAAALEKRAGMIPAGAHRDGAPGEALNGAWARGFAL